MSRTSVRFAALAALALTISACTEGSLYVPKHLRSVSSETLALMAERGMDQRAPILVRIFKAESQLEVWKQQRSGRYALLRTFEICRWSGDLGPKVREGDRQAPEGFYTVSPALMNPNSSYHLAFNTGFPNAFDRAHNRTGSHLMVHGDCSSRGCFAMTNAQMEEIFALARDAFTGGQRGIQLQIMPFRMTAENMFRFRRNENIAFWRNLKEGSDHFEATGRPPEVQVCGRRYVFDRRATDENARFEPTQACPPSELPTEIQVRVAQRQRQDAQVLARLEGEYQQRRQASSMLARVTGGAQQTAQNYTPAPHHAFPSRQAIRAALPTSSPEALSLLAGAEAGPTPELRRIARGELITPPASPAPGTTMVASNARRDATSEEAGATMALAAAATRPVVVAGIPVPQPSPLRRPAVPATESAGEGEGIAGSINSMLASVGIPAFAPAQAAPPPPTAIVPLPTAVPRAATARAAATPVSAPAPAAPVAQTPTPPSIWQRFLGRFTGGSNSSPVSQNASSN